MLLARWLTNMIINSGQLIHKSTIQPHLVDSNSIHSSIMGQEVERNNERDENKRQVAIKWKRRRRRRKTGNDQDLKQALRDCRNLKADVASCPCWMELYRCPSIEACILMEARREHCLPGALTATPNSYWIDPPFYSYSLPVRLSTY